MGREPANRGTGVGCSHGVGLQQQHKADTNDSNGVLDLQRGQGLLGKTKQQSTHKLKKISASVANGRIGRTAKLQLLAVWIAAFAFDTRQNNPRAADFPHTSNITIFRLRGSIHTSLTDPRLLPAHDQIRMMLRHDPLIPRRSNAIGCEHPNQAAAGGTRRKIYPPRIPIRDGNCTPQHPARLDLSVHTCLR